MYQPVPEFGIFLETSYRVNTFSIQVLEETWRGARRPKGISGVVSFPPRKLQRYRRQCGIELKQRPQPLKVVSNNEGTMTVNRLVVLIGSILGLIGIVAWIGELDLGLEESLPAPLEQPSDPQRNQ